MLLSDRLPVLVASTSVLMVAALFTTITPEHYCIPLINSTGQQLAQMFMPENISLNLEQLGRTAMNPMWLNNQSMLDLFAHVSMIQMSL